MLSGTSITLSNTIDGSTSGVGNLSLGSSGNITLSQAVGGITPMGTLQFTSGNTLSTQSISAASVEQTGVTTATYRSITTSNVNGISLSGTTITVNGSLITTGSGPCAMLHTGVLTLNYGTSSLLTGPFSESGMGGTVSLMGNLHAENSNITFANPITLIGDTTLNSNGGGDIVISSSITGPYDLIYTAGTGNITIDDTIDVDSVTITTAANVTVNDSITAGTFTQNSGSGTTQFNATLTTSQSGGVSLTGTAFVVDAEITTTNGGTVAINNSGALTIGAAFSSDGAFSQTGNGAVSLGANITTTGDDVSFAGAVTLTADTTINTGTAFGDISFASSLGGAHHLILDAGQGDVSFSTVSGLTLLQINSCNNLSSGSISASTVTFTGVEGLATLQAINAGSVTLNGAAFTLDGNITTSSSGNLAITNTELLTIAPSTTFSISGSLTQLGMGGIHLGGSVTAGANISFTSGITLTGNLTLTADVITFGSDLEGPYSIQATTTSGGITALSAISVSNSLQNFTAISANNISLNGVGLLTGTLSLTAANTISLGNTAYSAQTQYYNSGGDLDFTNGGLTTLTSTGGNITFASSTAVLSTGSNLTVNTNGGEFTYNTIEGTTFESLTINTGSGTALLGAIGPNINTVTVNAGQILLNGVLNMTNTDFTSTNSILNNGSPLSINSSNTATFNSLNGNVGSEASPLLVNTNNQIYAGAESTGLADFTGTSVDDTVHLIPSNPPCYIIWNGTTIKSCTVPPPPPPPSPTPPSTPKLPYQIFATPGFNSSWYNLSSDFYFLPSFLDESYIRVRTLLYASGE